MKTVVVLIFIACAVIWFFFDYARTGNVIYLLLAIGGVAAFVTDLGLWFAAGRPKEFGASHDDD